jgi:hypothetical protein
MEPETFIAPSFSNLPSLSSFVQPLHFTNKTTCSTRCALLLSSGKLVWLVAVVLPPAVYSLFPIAPAKFIGSIPTLGTLCFCLLLLVLTLIACLFLCL